MKSIKNKTDVINYILTFAAVVVVIGSFATQLITGKSPLIPLDSLAGSLVLGIIFVLYLSWFIFDTAATQMISLSESARMNLTTNPAAYCVYAFWLVFIIIPALLNSIFSGS